MFILYLCYFINLFPCEAKTQNNQHSQNSSSAVPSRDRVSLLVMIFPNTWKMSEHNIKISFTKRLAKRKASGSLVHAFAYFGLFKFKKNCFLFSSWTRLMQYFIWGVMWILIYLIVNKSRRNGIWNYLGNYRLSSNAGFVSA